MSGSDGSSARPSVRRFLEMKRRGERIAALTAYDVLFARLLEDVGIDLILVGDSLAEVVLGHESTLPVTMDEMIHHARAVRRGAPDTFTVLDLPFLSYQLSEDEAVRSAGRVLKEDAAHAVKVEGGDARTCSLVDRLVGIGIPVMGHVGFTPQSVHAMGGYRVQGRDESAAHRILEEARALERAGCFSVVLELVPASLAGRVTETLGVPTIGIGAGPDCDGQILVLPDALGLNPGFRPRFLKRFAELYEEARAGVETYVRDVRRGDYPGPEHSFRSEEAG